MNVTKIVQIKSDCYEQFRKSKFIQRHVSVDRFLTCGYTCNRVTSKKILAASVALKKLESVYKFIVVNISK